MLFFLAHESVSSLPRYVQMCLDHPYGLGVWKDADILWIRVIGALIQSTRKGLLPKSVRTIHSPGYWSPGYRDTSAHSLYQTKKHRIKVSEKGSIHSRKQQVSAEVKERLSAEKQALNAAHLSAMSPQNYVHSLYQETKYRIKVSETGSVQSWKRHHCWWLSAEVKQRLSAEKQALNAAQGVETPNEEGAATAEIDAGEEEHMDDEHDLYHNHEEYNDDGSDEEYAEAHHEVWVPVILFSKLN